MVKKTLSSWFALFLLGLYAVTPCYAGDNQQKWNRLETNLNMLLNNAQSYQTSLKEAEQELTISKQQLEQANKELKLLKNMLEMSQRDCERTKQSLENANSLLKSYEKNMKAKINKQKRQKYLYAALSIGAIIYAKSK